MEIRTTEEIRTQIESFAKRYLNLQMQKKALSEDEKELKTEFKEEGVPVSIVTSAIRDIMKDKKKTDAQKFEEATIREWVETNPDIDNDIGTLMAK